MIKYEVRFVIYQYNGGGSIKNGNQKCSESYLTREAAEAFYKTVKKYQELGQSPYEFIRNYVWDGYLVSADGLYEITDRKIL